MATNNRNMSAEQIRATQQRKKRVQKIKNTIVFIVVFILLGSVASSIYLNIRVANLQSQIDTLTETTINDYMKLASEQAKKEFEKENEKALSSTYTPEDTSVNNDSVDEVDTSNIDISYIYDCLDSSDNIAGADDAHYVYLTFDDGPSINTDKILEVLSNHGVKATFFVTGRDEETQSSKYADIFEAGHTIGVHSFSHKYNELYTSKEAFSADLDRICNTIYDVTGEYPKYYRFPGGSNCDYSVTDMDVFIKYLGQKNMKYFDWNVSSGDANSQIYSVDELVDNVMNDVVKYKYSVVLMHDASDKTKTVEALDVILSRLDSIGAYVLPITDDSPVIHLSGENIN